MKETITGYTSLYALFGNPVEHSKSPEMYQYTFQALKMDSVYLALTAEEADMAHTFQAIRSMGIKGGNFKNENGRIIGHNTDGKGFIDNLKVNGHDITGKKVVLLGCGAAATAIAVQALIEGAQEIAIFNRADRFYQNGEALQEKLTTEFPERQVTLNPLEDERLLIEAVKNSDFLFNATKVGMAPLEAESLIKDHSVFHSELVVADTVYNPLETKLVTDAKAAAVKATFGGIGMLLYQGAAGFQFMTGQSMPVEDVKRDVYGL